MDGHGLTRTDKDTSRHTDGQEVFFLPVSESPEQSKGRSEQSKGRS